MDLKEALELVCTHANSYTQDYTQVELNMLELSAYSEDLAGWIESLTEDEIDGLTDPHGYNLAEAEDW